MGRLPIANSPDLLVGAATGDDAAVWRIDDTRALVATVDFITPVVDDARTWGRIAATNSVSDVYAMGGTPVFALNIAGWARDTLPLELLGDAMAGIGDVATAAGFVIVGGHTIDDPEPKLGLAVIGFVDPARMLTNAGLRAGQVLILTKPLGIGVITTAIKQGRADEGAVAAAVEVMTTLNDVASRVAIARGATGATDVTGFGLLGHGGRMARESGVDLSFSMRTVPVLDAARRLLADGVFPGGGERNLASVVDSLDVDSSVSPEDVRLLADPQTSGGLLFAVDESSVDQVLRELASAAVVGRVGTATGTGRVRITW